MAAAASAERRELRPDGEHADLTDEKLVAEISALNEQADEAVNAAKNKIDSSTEKRVTVELTDAPESAKEKAAEIARVQKEKLDEKLKTFKANIKGMVEAETKRAKPITKEVRPDEKDIVSTLGLIYGELAKPERYPPPDEIKKIYRLMARRGSVYTDGAYTQLTPEESAKIREYESLDSAVSEDEYQQMLRGEVPWKLNAAWRALNEARSGTFSVTEKPTEEPPQKSNVIPIAAAALGAGAVGVVAAAATSKPTPDTAPPGPDIPPTPPNQSPAPIPPTTRKVELKGDQKSPTERIIEDFFAFSDIPNQTAEEKEKNMQEILARPEAEKYSVALEILFTKYKRVEVLDISIGLILRCAETLKKLGIQRPTAKTVSTSWAYWDIAQKYYQYLEDGSQNPEKDPMQSAEIQQELVDGQVGWELYASVVAGNGTFTESLNRKDATFAQIMELLAEKPDAQHTLPKEKLIKLGALVRKNLEYVAPKTDQAAQPQTIIEDKTEPQIVPPEHTEDRPIRQRTETPEPTTEEEIQKMFAAGKLVELEFLRVKKEALVKELERADMHSAEAEKQRNLLHVIETGLYDFILKRLKARQPTISTEPTEPLEPPAPETVDIGSVVTEPLVEKKEAPASEEVRTKTRSEIFENLEAIKNERLEAIKEDIAEGKEGISTKLEERIRTIKKTKIQSAIRASLVKSKFITAEQNEILSNETIEEIKEQVISNTEFLASEAKRLEEEFNKQPDLQKYFAETLSEFIDHNLPEDQINLTNDRREFSKKLRELIKEHLMELHEDVEKRISAPTYVRGTVPNWIRGMLNEAETTRLNQEGKVDEEELARFVTGSKKNSDLFSHEELMSFKQELIEGLKSLLQIAVELEGGAMPLENKKEKDEKERRSLTQKQTADLKILFDIEVPSEGYSEETTLFLRKKLEEFARQLGAINGAEGRKIHIARTKEELKKHLAGIK